MTEATAAGEKLVAASRELVRLKDEWQISAGGLDRAEHETKVAAQRERVAELRARFDELTTDPDCQVCQHPARSLIEAEVYLSGRPNEDVARLFGLGDGSPVGGDIIRQHRLAGHMRPRDHYKRLPLGELREEAEAIAAQRAGQ